MKENEKCIFLKYGLAEKGCRREFQGLAISLTQSGLGVGCKLFSSSKELCGLGVRAQVRV